MRVRSDNPTTYISKESTLDFNMIKQREYSRLKKNIENSNRRTVGRADRGSDGLSDGALDGSVAQSLGRSVDRSVARSIARSLDRSLRRSIDRSLGRSIDPSIDRSLDRPLGRAIDRSKKVSPKRMHSRYGTQSRPERLDHEMMLIAMKKLCHLFGGLTCWWPFPTTTIATTIATIFVLAMLLLLKKARALLTIQNSAGTRQAQLNMATSQCSKS